MPPLPMQARPRRSDQLAVRRLGDEVLLVPIRSDPAQPSGIYTLNRTAGLLWDQIDGSRTVADLVAALVERFEVEAAQARADVQELLADLIAAGAVELP